MWPGEIRGNKAAGGRSRSEDTDEENARSVGVDLEEASFQPTLRHGILFKRMDFNSF